MHHACHHHAIAVPAELLPVLLLLNRHQLAKACARSSKLCGRWQVSYVQIRMRLPWTAEIVIVFSLHAVLVKLRTAVSDWQYSTKDHCSICRFLIESKDQ
jgi:hypothetical protein